ncbi:13094_t:CDS:2, partial [Funneliformis caledonium]
QVASEVSQHTSNSGSNTTPSSPQLNKAAARITLVNRYQLKMREKLEYLDLQEWDRNVSLVTDVPGIRKSRLLIECVNHIRKSFLGFLKDLVDLIIVSYNNGNTPSNLDLQLGAEKSLSLQLLHSAFVNPSRKYIEFVVNLKREGF